MCLVALVRLCRPLFCFVVVHGLCLHRHSIRADSELQLLTPWRSIILDVISGVF